MPLVVLTVLAADMGPLVVLTVLTEEKPLVVLTVLTEEKEENAVETRYAGYTEKLLN